VTVRDDSTGRDAPLSVPESSGGGASSLIGYYQMTAGDTSSPDGSEVYPPLTSLPGSTLTEIDPVVGQPGLPSAGLYLMFAEATVVMDGPGWVGMYGPSGPGAPSLFAEETDAVQGEPVVLQSSWHTVSIGPVAYDALDQKAASFLFTGDAGLTVTNFFVTIVQVASVP